MMNFTVVIVGRCCIVIDFVLFSMIGNGWLEFSCRRIRRYEKEIERVPTGTFRGELTVQ